MAGPDSAPIRSADDWNTLFDRCLSHRSDLLGKVLRQSLAHQARPDLKVIALLKGALDDTAQDFTAQTQLLAGKVEPKHRDDIIRAGTNYSALGYALVDSEGDPVEISNPRSVNDRVSVERHRYAHYGWGSFLPLNVPERAPQVRMSTLSGQEIRNGVRLTWFSGHEDRLLGLKPLRRVRAELRERLRESCRFNRQKYEPDQFYRPV